MNFRLLKDFCVLERFHHIILFIIIILYHKLLLKCSLVTNTVDVSPCCQVRYSVLLWLICKCMVIQKSRLRVLVDFNLYENTWWEVPSHVQKSDTYFYITNHYWYWIKRLFEKFLNFNQNVDFHYFFLSQSQYPDISSLSPLGHTWNVQLTNANRKWDQKNSRCRAFFILRSNLVFFEPRQPCIDTQ
mgnify:CR=1 FL=1